jgi:hypothetical protein
LLVQLVSEIVVGKHFWQWRLVTLYQPLVRVIR